MAKLAPIFSNLSEKLIKQFGRKATLQTITKGAYNPMTGQSTTVKSNEVMILQGVYSSKEYGTSENYPIQLGDIPIYSYTKLDKKDNIVINNVKYAIIHVDEYVAEDKTVLYVANIRGAK